MTEFQVGDRVAVYYYQSNSKGAIQQISPYGGILVLYDGDQVGSWAHPKQCRKLIKKPKKSVWIAPIDITSQCAQPCISHEPKEGWVEFVERKKP